MSEESQLLFLHLRAIEGADNTGNVLPTKPPPPSLCSGFCDFIVAPPYHFALGREMSLWGERVRAAQCTGLNLSLYFHPEGLQSNLWQEGETHICVLWLCEEGFCTLEQCLNTSLSSVYEEGHRKTALISVFCLRCRETILNKVQESREPSIKRRGLLLCWLLLMFFFSHDC